MNKQYEEMIDKYNTLKGEKNNPECEVDDEFLDVVNYLLDNNSFKNTLEEEMALDLIKEHQQIYLDSEGGWPLQEMRSFEVNGKEYGVIAWGASGSGEGKHALKGILFVKY